MDTYVIKFPFMDIDTQDGKLTPNYLKSELTGEYGYAPRLSR